MFIYLIRIDGNVKDEFERGDDRLQPTKLEQRRNR